MICIIIPLLSLRIIKTHTIANVQGNKEYSSAKSRLCSKYHYIITNIDWKDIKSSKPNKQAIKCLNNKFKDILGTYVLGIRSLIIIHQTEMISTIADSYNLTKFIHAQYSRLEIENSVFISDTNLNNQLKICSIDPVGLINMLCTLFKNLTYKDDSSSGILFMNQNNKENFSVNFIECKIIIDNEINFIKGRKGGFFYQSKGNSNITINNCIFSGCSSQDEGGCLYITSNANVTGCVFDDCRSKDGSAIYFAPSSKNHVLLDLVVQNIKNGNNIISLNSEAEKCLEIKNIIFRNLSNLESQTFGIKLSSNIEKISFRNCSFADYCHNYLIFSSDIPKVEIVSCSFEFNNFDSPSMLIQAQEVILEDIIYHENRIYGTFSGDKLTIRSCKFYGINIAEELLILKTNFISIDNCSFIDIESNCRFYGGLGLNTYECIEMNITNCLFEHVGSSEYSGGILILQEVIQWFQCIDSKCIRCYSHCNNCGFVLMDTTSVSTRNITVYFINVIFDECHLVPMISYPGSAFVCAIRFNIKSFSAYIEINSCTFINPGRYEDYNNRQCMCQITAQNFSLISNTVINCTNSISSCSYEAIESQFLTDTFNLINHTLINCSSHDNSMYFGRVRVFNFIDCCFKSVFNLNGYGMGIVIDRPEGLEISFSNCTFINCSHGQSAPVYITVSSKGNTIKSFTIKDCYVEGIQSKRDGAFKLISTTATISNTIFKSCTSESNGDCLFCNALKNLTIHNCT